MKKLRELIEAQRKGKEDTPVWMVGEQLLDIAAGEPDSLELLKQDLTVPEMSLENAEKVGAEDLSVKDLKAAIAERDAEKKRNEELEGKLAELDKSRADAEAAAAHVDDLKNRISELEKNLDAEKEATQKAKENLKKAKENPKIPQEKLEAIKKEAEAAAKQEIEESTGKELSELRDKLKAAEEAKTKADKDKAEAEKKLSEAEKKLKTASPEVNAFKVMFVAFQEAGNKCRKQIEIIREGDPETAGKLMAAMASFADSIAVK